ncbi:hypothetical protein ACFLX3_05290 [Chloroflexota bacterium]
MKVDRRLLGVILAILVTASAVAVVQPVFGDRLEQSEMQAEVVWEVKLPTNLRARFYEIAIVPGTSEVVATSHEAIWRVDRSGKFEPVIRLRTGGKVGEGSTLAASGKRAGILIQQGHVVSGFKLIDLQGKVLAAVETPENFHYRIAPWGDSFVGIDAAGEHIPVNADRFLYTFFDDTGKVNGEMKSLKPQPLDSAYTADGNAFVVSNAEGLFAYRIEDARLLWTVPRTVRYFAAAAAPTGLVVTSYETPRNVIEAYAEGKSFWRFELEGNVRNLAISLGGEFMLATDRHTAYLFGAGKGSPLFTYPMPVDGLAINSVAVNDLGLVALGGQRPEKNGGLVVVLDPDGKRVFQRELDWELSNAWIAGVQFDLGQDLLLIRTLEELVLVSLK